MYCDSQIGSMTDGQIAQVAEHLTGNLEVPGSNPGLVGHIFPFLLQYIILFEQIKLLVDRTIFTVNTKLMYLMW